MTPNDTPEAPSTPGGSAAVPGPAGPVFISHAATDREAAEVVCAGLESAGFRGWIAPRDVPAGAFYADAIIEAINAASVFVVILSAHSVTSQHVLREVERAGSKRRPIIAIRLDASPLPSGLEYFLSTSQWIEAPTGPSEALPALLAGVRRLGNASSIAPVAGSGGATSNAGTPVEGGNSWARFKRHKVAQWTLAYAAFAFAALRGVALLRDAFGWPHETLRVSTLVMLVLLPVVPVVAWYQGVRALKRVTATELLIIGLLLVIGGGLSWVVPHPSTPAAEHATSSQLPRPSSERTAGEKSIAVLPFADLSDKQDERYFAEGVAEELRDRLAKVPGLVVAGSVSSAHFKESSGNYAQIGEALHVSYLLQGSVRRNGNRVRVTAQLIDASTGAQKWAEHFDADAVDVLDVQDAIAMSVARPLQIVVEAEGSPRLRAKSAEVMDAYLRGLQLVDGYTREGCTAAVAQFERALEMDPDFAPAALGLARAFVHMGEEAWLTPAEAYQKAREAAVRAQHLDPMSPQPHLLLATIHTYFDWDWPAAEAELKRALELGPRNSLAAQTEARLAAAQGQWARAKSLAVEAVELDPLNSDALGTLGTFVYLRVGAYEDAERVTRRELAVAPKAGSGQYFLGLTLMLQKRYPEALKEFQKETIDDGRYEGSSLVYFAMGKKAESDAQLALGLRQNGGNWASEMARVYAFRGEKDLAFEWLEKAYQAHDEDLYFIKGDPLLKNLEGDPRYDSFLQRMHLAN